MTQPTNGTTHPTNKKSIPVGLVAMCMFLLMAFVMGLLKIYSPDLGFHLKSAAWILEHKAFIYTDPFSYGSNAHKYYDLQWLYQLITYGLYSKGTAVLIVANSLFIVISLLLVWGRFLKYSGIKNSNLKLGLVAFMGVLFIQPLSFETRPQVFSWICLNLILFFLEWYKKENKKRLFLLPIIMVVWVNMHSIAIIGLVVIAIYNVGIYAEQKKIDKTLLLYSAISFAAFFINPYFIDGFLYAISQFGIISGNSLFKSYLGELQSPFTANEISMLGAKYFTNPLIIIHIASLFSIFSIIRAIVQKEFTNALMLVSFLVLLYLAHRNYSIFILVSLPLFVKYLLNYIELRSTKKLGILNGNASKERQQIQVTQLLAKRYRRASFAAIFIAIFISLTSITDGFHLFTNATLRFGFTTNEDELPVGATTFLNENNIKGSLLNHLDFGGYLMAHYNEKVFIDGRMDLFEEPFFEKYYASLTDRNGFKKLIEAYDPAIVVFPYVKASNWWQYFIVNKNRSGYKAVYFDGLAVIYVKSSMYPQLVELAQSNAILDANDSSALSRINSCIENTKPNKFMVLINGLWQKQAFSISNQNKATYCFTNGFDTAGIIYSVKGIEHSTTKTPNIFKNLSIFYQEKKRYDLAQMCEDKSE